MCTLIALLLSMADCVPPDPRPLYKDLWAVYAADPDCLNRDRHIGYLVKLRDMPMRTGDTVTVSEYNHALDLYIERFEKYCQ